MPAETIPVSAGILSFNAAHLCFTVLNDCRRYRGGNLRRRRFILNGAARLLLRRRVLVQPELVYQAPSQIDANNQNPQKREYNGHSKHRQNRALFHHL
jgi:hypothetical protein